MRILLAGMNYEPNQFTRNLEKLGVEVVKTSGDPGAFPNWCEAAIVAKCQCSHQKFYDVKDAYTKQRKPVFIGDNFSSIKERLVEFIASKKAERDTMIIRRTAMGQALARAGAVGVTPEQAKKALEAAVAPPKLVIEPAQEKKETEVRDQRHAKDSTFAHRYDPKVKKEIWKQVKEAQDAGMTAQETADLLKAHGLTLADGVTNFTALHVYSIRQEIKANTERHIERPVTHKTVAKVQAAPSKPAANEFQLLSRILDLDLSDEKTVQFQRWLKDGKINLEQALWFLDVIDEKGK